MSFFNYPECQVTESSPVIPLIFLGPLLLRNVIKTQIPVSALSNKSYFLLCLIGISTYSYNNWPSYSTYIIFSIFLNMFILHMSTVSNVQINNYLEVYNTFTFTMIPFSSLLFWTSTVIVWLMNLINNFSSAKFFEIAMALLETTCAVLGFNEANNCNMKEFYFLAFACSLLLVIHSEIKTSNK